MSSDSQPMSSHIGESLAIKLHACASGEEIISKDVFRLLLDLSNAARMGELCPNLYLRIWKLQMNNQLPEITAPAIDETEDFRFDEAPHLLAWEQASTFDLTPYEYGRLVEDFGAGCSRANMIDFMLDEDSAA